MDNTTVQTQIEELSSVRRKVTAWRLSQIAVLLIVVVACVLQLRYAVTSLATEGPKRDELASQLGGAMQEDILPRLQDIGSQAVNRIDFNKQIGLLNQRAPDVANATLAQSRMLATNLRQRGQNVLKAQFEQALEARAAKLQAEFPDANVEDVQAFIGGLTEEAQLQVAEITADFFNPHIESINAIAADIEAIKKSETIPADADLPTWEVAFLFIDIARADLTLDGEIAAKPLTPKAVAQSAGTAKAGKEKK